MIQTFRLNSRNKDAIEAYISELTNKKTDKWKETVRKQRKEAINERIQSQEIISAAESELIDEIHRCLDEDRDEEKMSKIINRHAYFTSSKPLPISVTCEILEFYVSLGNSIICQQVLQYIKAHNEEFYDANLSYFEALELELDWRTGQNMDELLEKFEVAYNASKGIEDENKTKYLMRFYTIIMQDAIEKKGESAVIKLKEKIEEMCEKDGRDYFLLFDLWRKLFESFWYSDQQIAAQLISNHTALRKLLSKQLSFLCFIYLRNNNTELVNRLIQIFLQFNMKKQIEIAVKILFDFECWRKNLDSALQIVQLCLKLDIILTDKENKKFLDLLLKRTADDKSSVDKRKITTPKYQFKF